MGIFNFFKQKPVSTTDNPSDVGRIEVEEFLSERYPLEDYLGQAAGKGHAAKAAVKEGQHDAAWRLLHEQKALYMQHASRCGWQAKDVLCLDGSVSQQFANILRLEKKHDQALVHILYWITTSRNQTKGQEQKLRAYFNRCKFQDITLQDVEKFIEVMKSKPDYVSIQSQVSEWRDH